MHTSWKMHHLRQLGNLQRLCVSVFMTSTQEIFRRFSLFSIKIIWYTTPCVHCVRALNSMCALMQQHYPTQHNVIHPSSEREMNAQCRISCATINYSAYITQMFCGQLNKFTARFLPQSLTLALSLSLSFGVFVVALFVSSRLYFTLLFVSAFMFICLPCCRHYIFYFFSASYRVCACAQKHTHMSFSFYWDSRAREEKNMPNMYFI